MDTATKTVLDALKTISKKVVDKATEVTGELIGNKIAEKLWNQNLYLMQIRNYFTRQEILSNLRQVLWNRTP